MGMNENFKYLSIGLPEDIERRKQHGDFAGAVRLIDARMTQPNVPLALKKCMAAEREMMLRVTEDYPYSKEEALAIIHKDLPDFTEAEFDAFVDERRIDWIYVNGEERYVDSFYGTLTKAYPDFAARINARKSVETAIDNFPTIGQLEKALEDKEIAYMKEHGSTAWRFRLRLSAKLKDEAFEAGKLVRAYLPIPAACTQFKEIVINDCSDCTHFIAPEDAGQRTICFETRLQENREFFVDFTFTAVYKYTDAYHAKGKPGVYDFELDEQQPHIVFSPYMKDLVANLTVGVTDPMEKARIFYDFVTKNVRYSFMRDYFGLNAIAENCARNFRGDCGVQALLFITLCRTAGIPARWQSGLTCTEYSTGMHDWAQFYVAPYGWLFADCSYGGGSFRNGRMDRHEFYFGNLDPFRFVANRRWQADFEPDMTNWRVDPYDNQVGEMEYEDRALTRADYVLKREFISGEKLDENLF